ncbi:MAG TPA: hypothetical protein VM802_25570 [Chitinophaga sp.]|uniref:hypothetical protein n=1 Tax=Chitinophaga sp. TaxID=1869181 RepID=UPI002C4135B8|nr:hypothetical protein [Chitinophaga sp.]HVI48263.1 hypothetical protein [Chitinophaga sp.]
MIVNKITAHVFLKPELQQVDDVVIERLLTEHPYFAAAHLLLAKKKYLEHGDLRDATVKKALLYSNQHHHFYQLVTAGNPETSPVVDIPIPLPEVPAFALKEAIPAPAVAETVILDDAVAHVPDLAEEEEIPASTIAEAVMQEAISAPMPDIAKEEESPASTVTEVTTPENAASIAPEPAAILTAATEPEELPAPATTLTDTEEAPAGNKSDEEQPIKIFPLAIPEEEMTLTFQPLYTDDYFAYKRLKDPGGAADELNEQGMAEMKSFTSWLRQIKDNFAGKTNKDWYHQQLHRIYEEDEEPEISETVEKMAMDSITFNNDIVSETLAEIWVRQHQYENAIRIYQKLSLINPDKNAYFAQKIQELKSQKDKNKH